MLDLLFFIGLFFLVTFPTKYEGEELNVIGGFIAVFVFPAYIILWFAVTGRI